MKPLQDCERIHQFPVFREREPRIIGNAELLRYQELLESSIRTRFQKDLAGTLLAWEALERDHTPFPEPLMRETMAHIQTPVLREAVARRQDFYARQLQTSFDYQGSLKSNDIMAGLTDGTKFCNASSPLSRQGGLCRHLGQMVRPVQGAHA